MAEGRWCVADREDGGRAQEPQAAALEAGKRKDTEPPLESLEGAQPYRHYAFGPRETHFGFLVSRNVRE